MRSSLLSACLLLSGCFAPANVADLSRGAVHIAADLAAQLGGRAGAASKIAVDTMLDGRTGQQTKASALMQTLVSNAIPAATAGAKMVGLDPQTVDSAGLLATGIITALDQKDQYQMNVSVTDRSSGLVVAQSAARFLQAAIDERPTRVFNDSPAVAVDRAVAGYIRTAQAEPGVAADPEYVEQLPAAALIASAQEAYNAGQWEQALASYESAARQPGGMQLRTLNGIYLSNVKLGRHKEAEAAFAKIVAVGFANEKLSVKLLFSPGGTTFWPDSSVSAAYPMWIRQIARTAEATHRCLDVIGHTSHSGTEEYNRQLSRKRAEAIRALLGKSAPALRNARVEGVGFAQNLVGTGSDDASDAVDRRVEFRVVPCTQGALAESL